MKLGILGTGMIVKDVLTMYHELGVEKTYLFSTKKSKSQALELIEKYHLDKVYTDYDELLQSDVDTIYCALPNHLHYEFSKKALKNGKNVIIEKPITANSKELEDLIETANKKNLMIFEAMNLHYTPAFLSLKEDLKKLGDIKIVSFNYSQYSSRYNAFKEGIILPAFDFHKAGGALMDLNVYNIHALIDLFGKPIYHKYMANIERNIDTSGYDKCTYNSYLLKYDELYEDRGAGNTCLTSLSKEEIGSIKNPINKILNQGIGVSENVGELLKNAQAEIPKVKSLASLSGFSGNAEGTIALANEKIPEAKAILNDFIDAISKINNSEDTKDLINFLKNDVMTNVDFLKSPVDIVQKTIYPMTNYGASMTPFYTLPLGWYITFNITFNYRSSC